MSLNVCPPQAFDTEAPGANDRFKQWKGCWERYILLSGAKQKSEEYQIALLLHCLGPACVQIFEAFTFSATEDATKIKDVAGKFEKHFSESTKDFIERIKFYRRAQQEHESFDVFLGDLKAMVKTCGFCNCIQDTLILDRIIMGHKDRRIREKLLAQEKLDLKSAVSMCKAAEATASHLQIVNEEEEIRRIKTAPKHKKKPQIQSKKTCRYCGRDHPFEKSKCPAFGKTCRACEGKNHFQKMCKSSKTKSVRAIAGSTSSDEEVISSMEVVQAVSEKKSVHCEMYVEGKRTNFLIDCGATVNVITSNLIPKGATVNTDGPTLRMWDGSTVQSEGTVILRVVNPKTGEKFRVKFVKVARSLTPLIGMSAAQKMGLLSVNYTAFKEVNNVTAISTLAEYKNIFDEASLGILPGRPVKLNVKEDACPSVRPARTLPEALRKKVKEEIDGMCLKGILAPQENPTDWCNQMVVAEKKNGQIRICVDPVPLNEHLCREYYKLPTLEDILPRLQGACYFSVCDLRSGYWHIQLEEESTLLTTMATPWGRYRWLRLPFGLNVSSEIFQRRVHQALDGLEGTVCIADDILVYGKTEKDHDVNLKALLERCQTTGIRLNKEKCRIKVQEVEFMGHIVTKDGLKMDPKKAKAIIEMPAPTCKKDLERFRGMVNYLAKFVPRLSDTFAQMNSLMKKETPWQWGKAQENSFKKTKQLIASAQTLSFYNEKKALTIQTDASSTGIGAVALQEGRPIAFMSRSLSDTERRYATIEKEMLAIVFGTEKMHQITYGRRFQVQTDHKPLTSIVKKPLEKAPKRLQGMLLRVLAYDVELSYLEGSKMIIADALSRAYQTAEDNQQEDLERINAVDYLPMRPERLKEIQNATKEDSVLKEVSAYINSKWPDKVEDDTLSSFFSVRDELSTQNDLVFRGQRLVIPKQLQKKMLDDLHRAHQGVDSTLRLARESVFWPGLNKDVRMKVKSCERCASHAPAQAAESLKYHEVPNRPWSKVGLDLMDFKGRTYLISVCYYSNFWEIDYLRSTSTGEVIRKLKAHCARYGKMDEIMSDNGPQFASEEFKSFCKKWDIVQVTSSPYHPKSNGKAEAAVKLAKNLLKRTDDGEDFFLALMAQRNTPRQDKLSPTELMMGRKTKTILPITSETLSTQVSRPKDVPRRNAAKPGRVLPDLRAEDAVWVRTHRPRHKKWSKGKIVRLHSTLRYLYV
eukprot:GHVO01029710.1.p1 GENE.GHVO01029710.1~~GHVO01029710.1.p1  ORF type:complete len:1206 (-),score=132.44 GHVO01029710.1:398-4015(-)